MREAWIQPPAPTRAGCHCCCCCQGMQPCLGSRGMAGRARRMLDLTGKVDWGGRPCHTWCHFSQRPLSGGESHGWGYGRCSKNTFACNILLQLAEFFARLKCQEANRGGAGVGRLCGRSCTMAAGTAVQGKGCGITNLGQGRGATQVRSFPIPDLGDMLSRKK